MLDDIEDDSDDVHAFEIWPENEDICRLFFDLVTQWTVGMSGAVGLNYAAAEAVMRIRRLRDRAHLLDGLRVMERAALRELNRARK